MSSPNPQATPPMYPGPDDHSPLGGPTAPPETRWYFHGGLIAFLLFVFAPLGILLMWLQKPRSRFLGGAGTRVILTLFFGGIWIAVWNGGQSGREGHQEQQAQSLELSAPAAIQTAAAPVAPAIPLPSAQKAFIEAVESAEEPYRAAPNELKKSAVRTARGRAVRASLGGKRTFKQWLGTVAGMGTNGDGKAWIEVKLESTDIKLKTWNNGLSDIMDDTLIPQGGHLFDQIAELGKGTPVVVAGAFVSSDGADFVREASMSEAGSMLDPEFIVRFADVRPR